MSLNLCCECGSEVPAGRGQWKNRIRSYCSRRCGNKARIRAFRRRAGVSPADSLTEKTCVVCLGFFSTAAKSPSIYCGASCSYLGLRRKRLARKFAELSLAQGEIDDACQERIESAAS